MPGVRKVAVTVAGVAVAGVGVALLVLPGPGLIVVVLGLAILATEYDWARRWLATTKEKAKQASDTSVSNPVSTASTVLFALAIVAAGVAMIGGWAFSLFGVRIDELPGWGPFTGVILVLTGLLTLGLTGYSWREARRRAKVAPQGTDGQTAGVN